jgi:hypothetical protein
MGENIEFKWINCGLDLIFISCGNFQIELSLYYDWDIKVVHFTGRGSLFPPFFHLLNLLFSNPIEFIKIYIGQLPLDFEEYQLKEILQPMAELKEVK